jgi:ABC-type phosphate transport system substrate-binding protein
MQRLISVMIALVALTMSLRAQVVIIAHPSVSAKTIDKRTLTEIYTVARTEWKDGDPVHTFALQRGAPAAEAFYRFIGIDGLSLRKVWLRAQLTGEGPAPTVVSEAEMVKVVGETPGAIGIIGMERVTDRVKVLRQIGE